MIDGLSLADTAILTIGTLVVSLLVSAVGPTGGLQLAVVAWSLPAPLAIPLHAAITGVSAGMRAINLRRHIDWRYVVAFLPCSLGASVAVMPLLSHLHTNIFELIVGGFIVLSSLHGLISRPTTTYITAISAPVPAGLISGAVTVFVGATGQLLYAMMAPRFSDREALMATHSMCLTLQHASKIALFGVFGLLIFRYPVLIAATLIASLVGTYIGTRLLSRISESLYRRLLSTTMFISGSVIILRAVRHS